MIVVDTNVLAYLFIDGEHTEHARKAWVRDPEWRAPPLWRAEFLNVLVVSHRAGLIDTRQLLDPWRAATSLMFRREIEPRGEEVLRCALTYSLSA